MSDSTSVGVVNKPFDMPKVDTGATFEERGGWLVCRLMEEFDLSMPQAGGIVGNLGFESGGFAKLQEISPVAGRGGYGWAQWTGSRRVAFENWCSEHSLAPETDEANYGYLVEELRTTQAHALEQVKKTTSLGSAVFTFGYFFERPGGTTSTYLPGDLDRVKWGERAIRGALAHFPPPLTPTPTPVSEPVPVPTPTSTPTPTSDSVPVPVPVPVPVATPAPVHTTIAAGGLGGALTTLAVWGLTSSGLTVPDNAEGALFIVFTAIGGILLHSRWGSFLKYGLDAVANDNDNSSNNGLLKRRNRRTAS